MTQEEARKIARPLEWERICCEDDLENEDITYEAEFGTHELRMVYIIYPTCDFQVVLAEALGAGPDINLYTVLADKIETLEEAQRIAEAHYLDFVSSLLK